MRKCCLIFLGPATSMLGKQIGGLGKTAHCGRAGMARFGLDLPHLLYHISHVYVDLHNVPCFHRGLVI